MTPSFGKIQAALVSATQETTLALANFNFDFASVKVDAPPEYKPIGRALTRSRVVAAENGTHHITARRLGAPFEPKLPQTPHLIKAYGSRASEVTVSMQTDNGSKTNGAFDEFIGPDGTSIWAAATSGFASIAVHLLACMLARVWPADEAVCIWNELVAARKRELRPAENVDSISINSAAILQLELTDAQLSAWDASARAWLRAADNAPTIKDKQARLAKAIGRIHDVPVNQFLGVYASVMHAWTTALETLDKVIAGASYSVQDGAVLLALSSWHLYPDLVVLRGVTEEI